EPPASKAQGTPPPAKLPEVFRPTSAPPIVETEQLTVEEAAEPSMGGGRPHHVAKVARIKKKQRTHVAARPRTAPDRSFAYFPQRPFSFDGRWCPDSEVRTILRHPHLRTSESKDTSNLLNLVWLWFGSPHLGLAASYDADFRTATLAVLSLQLSRSPRH